MRINMLFNFKTKMLLALHCQRVCSPLSTSHHCCDRDLKNAITDAFHSRSRLVCFRILPRRYHLSDVDEFLQKFHIVVVNREVNFPNNVIVSKCFFCLLFSR